MVPYCSGSARPTYEKQLKGVYEITIVLISAKWGYFTEFLKAFCGDKSLFCGATGTLCFRLQLTLPMGFKARVNAPSLAPYVTCTQRILGVKSDQAGARTINLSHVQFHINLVETVLLVKSMSNIRG